MSSKVKLKRHGTFSLREGWYSKGINALIDNSDLFTKNRGIELLGIGSNMVTSLKYWMTASDAVYYKNKKYGLTEFGKLIFDYDNYLESDFTWYLIHLKIVSNYSESPVFNIIQNNSGLNTFDSKDIQAVISNKFSKEGIEFSIDSLKSDISIYLRSYTELKTIDNPENNNSCPLSNLNLLKEVDRGYFIKTMPSTNDLNFLLVYYSLIEIINKDRFVIDDVMTMNNSPIQIFNLTLDNFLYYLNQMKNNDLIVINKTAGLNTVYIKQRLTINEIFEKYFGGDFNV